MGPKLKDEGPLDIGLAALAGSYTKKKLKDGGPLDIGLAVLADA
jgi:hypothetical protein